MLNLRLFIVLALLTSISFASLASDIIISEIHYNPIDGEFASSDYYEFVEIKNISAKTVDIGGYAFAEGITFTIPTGTSLAAGSYYTIARSILYFNGRYGFKPEAEYVTTKLSNKGESLVLLDFNKDTVANIKYQDSDPWPFLADGFGFSLTVADESGDLSDSDNWIASSEINGSPGQANPASSILPIYINEILANSEFPAVDSVELYNPNAVAVDISGWGMTDKVDSTFAFVFPAGTVVPANGYFVVAQGVASQTGNTVIATSDLHFGSGFGLSSMGDKIYLFSATNGQLTGFVDWFSFPESRVGQTINRIVTSENRIVYLEAKSSFGATNSLPEVGPLVFEEILYAPSDGRYEYIKVKNISTETVNIDLWDFSGIGFEKDSLHADLASNDFLYLIEDTITTEQFRKVMGIDDQTLILTYSKTLNNSGEEIAILEPGDTVFSGVDTIVPYYPVEVIRYNDKAPWPIDAANGKTLIRKDLLAFGNDPSNWTATELPLPTAILSGTSIADLNDIVVISGAQSTDPQGKTLTYFWQIKSPSGTFTELTETSDEISVSILEYGSYVVRLQVFNGEKSSFINDFEISVNEVVTFVATEVPKNLMIYPTLIDNSFTVELIDSEYEEIRVVTLNGSSVLEGKLTSGKNKFALNSRNLGEGYLLVFLSNENDVYATKVYYTGN